MMEEKRWCRNNILKTLRTSFKIICDFYVRVCTNNNTPHLGKYFFFLKSVFFLCVVPDLQEATVRWGKSIQVSMLSVQMASLYVPYIKYRYILSQFSQSHTRICSFIETEWRRGYRSWCLRGRSNRSQDPYIKTLLCLTGSYMLLVWTAQ